MSQVEALGLWLLGLIFGGLHAREFGGDTGGKAKEQKQVGYMKRNFRLVDLLFGFHVNLQGSSWICLWNTT